MKQSLKWFLASLMMLTIGFIVLGNAVTASMAVVTFTGVLLLLVGVLQIAVGVWAESGANRLLAWMLGGLTLFLGWSFLAHPLEGVLSLTMLILLLMVAAGIVQIVFSFRFSGTPAFWILAASGALSLILALVLLSSPEATMKLLGIVLGIQLASSGASFFGIGMHLREQGE